MISKESQFLNVSNDIITHLGLLRGVVAKNKK